MDAKFNVKETRLNVTIELTDITDEIYRDIVTYVSMRTMAEQEKKPAAIEPKPAAPMTANVKKIEPVATTSSKVVEKKPCSWKNKAYTSKDPDLSLAMDKFFKEIENSPNDYETVLMTMPEFVQRFPEFDKFGRMSIAHHLRMNCKTGERVVLKNEKGHWGPYTTYYIPVRKKKPNPMGDAIRKAREENRLTVKELAELIEYTPDIVKKWESGEYTPSSDGLAAMKLVLGEHYFEGLK